MRLTPLIRHMPALLLLALGAMLLNSCGSHDPFVGTWRFAETDESMVIARVPDGYRLTVLFREAAQASVPLKRNGDGLVGLLRGRDIKGNLVRSTCPFPKRSHLLLTVSPSSGELTVHERPVGATFGFINSGPLVHVSDQTSSPPRSL